MKFGKRVLLFLHWLASVLGMASIVFQKQTQAVIREIQYRIGEEYAHIAFIALMAVYAFLSIVCLVLIVKRDAKRGERGFITMDSSENGKVRIAVSAVEQMVRRALETVDGIVEAKIAISNQDDALNVTVKAVLAGGAHVPTVTLNVQRAIRQYVEMNCGVAVCTVSVNVQSISSTVEAPVHPAEPVQPAAQEPIRSAAEATVEPPVESSPETEREAMEPPAIPNESEEAYWQQETPEGESEEKE